MPEQNNQNLGTEFAQNLLSEAIGWEEEQALILRGATEAGLRAFKATASAIGFGVSYLEALGQGLTPTAATLKASMQTVGGAVGTGAGAIAGFGPFGAIVGAASGDAIMGQWADSIINGISQPLTVIDLAQSTVAGKPLDEILMDTNGNLYRSFVSGLDNIYTTPQLISSGQVTATDGITYTAGGVVQGQGLVTYQGPDGSATVGNLAPGTGQILVTSFPNSLTSPTVQIQPTGTPVPQPSLILSNDGNTGTFAAPDASAPSADATVTDTTTTQPNGSQSQTLQIDAPPVPGVPQTSVVQNVTTTPTQVNGGSGLVTAATYNVNGSLEASQTITQDSAGNTISNDISVVGAFPTQINLGTSPNDLLGVQSFFGGSPIFVANLPPSATGVAQALGIDPTTGNLSVSEGGIGVASCNAASNVALVNGTLGITSTPALNWNESISLVPEGTATQSLTESGQSTSAVTLDYNDSSLASNGSAAQLQSATLDGQNYAASNNSSFSTFVDNTTAPVFSSDQSTALGADQTILADDRTDIVTDNTSALPTDLQPIVDPLATEFSGDDSEQVVANTDASTGGDTYDVVAAPPPASPPSFSPPSAPPPFSPPGSPPPSPPPPFSPPSFAPPPYSPPPLSGGSSSFDPLVISINGQGINLVPYGQSGAKFDFANDGGAGPREQTGWVGPNTGLLVLDTGTSNLSGSNLLEFSDLAALDTNHDGVLDASDPAFAHLEVWIDSNGDGIAQSSELVPLSALGIQSINVASTAANVNVGGNIVDAVGSLTFANGSTEAVDEVTFATTPQAASDTLNGQSAASLTLLQRAQEGLPAQAKGDALAADGTIASALSAVEQADGVVAYDMANFQKPTVVFHTGPTVYGTGPSQTVNVYEGQTGTLEYRIGEFTLPANVRNLASAVESALSTAESATQMVATAAADQTISETKAVIANVENAVVGTADDGAARQAATATEQAWQTALGAVAAAALSLKNTLGTASDGYANNTVDGQQNYITAQVQFDANNWPFLTSLDAREQADGLSELKTISEAMGVSESALQSLMAAAAQAWNVSQATLALSGQSLTVSGNDLVVAASGSESVGGGTNSTVYAVLSGANLTIANFVAGAGGSRLDFLLGASGAVTVSQGSSGVVISSGAATATLLGISLSSLSLEDNITGVGQITVDGSINVSPGVDAGIDDGVTHALSLTAGSTETLNVAGDSHVLSGGSNSANVYAVSATGDDNQLDGGAGTNILSATGTGNVLMATTGSSDTLTASGNQNSLFAGSGNDGLSTTGNDNRLVGGKGGSAAYNLTAIGNNNELAGQTGTNVLLATGDNNLLYATTGTSDTLTATGDDNTLEGGTGNDRLVAEGNDDVLVAGTGHTAADFSAAPGPVSVDLSKGTVIDGYGGTDTLRGITTVIGSSTGGTLTAGTSDDVLVGNGSNTTFVMVAGGGSAANFGSGDTITIVNAPSATSTVNATYLTGSDMTGEDNSTYGAPIMAEGDFNGDGTTDVLWRDSSGNTNVSYMQTTGLHNDAFIQVIGLTWAVQAVGNFFGVGTSDLWVRNTSSADTCVWSIDPNTNTLQGDDLGIIGFSWRFLATGSFLGDGRDEELVQNSDGTTAVWWDQHGDSVPLHGIPLGQTSMTVTILNTGNYLGDGKAEMLVDNTADNHLYVWYVDSSDQLQKLDYGADWTGGNTWMASGSFLGDGRSEILIKNNADDHMYVWSTPTSGPLQGHDLGADWAGVSLIATGDFKGDGKMEMLVQNNTDHHVYEWWVQKSTVQGVDTYTLQGVDFGAVGTNWSIIGEGDYNGDGRTSILWRNSVTDQTSIWFMDGTSFNGENLAGLGANGLVSGASIVGGASQWFVGGATASQLTGSALQYEADFSHAASGVIANLATQAEGGGAVGSGISLSQVTYLIGSAYADTLTAGGSGDTIDGGGGADTLIGSAAGGDTFIVRGADTINGGGSNNTINYVSYAGPIAMTLMNGNGSDLSNDTFNDIQDIIGSTASDTLTGTGNSYIFNGGTGSNDTLTANGSNDTLIGGSGGNNLLYARGQNVIEGQGSNNTVTYAWQTNPATGVTATLPGAGASTTDSLGDTLTDIQNIIGSAGNDTLTAGGSGETLDGGGGADTLIGSTAGSDTFIIRGASKIIDQGSNDTASYAWYNGPLSVTLMNGNGSDEYHDTFTNIQNIIGSSGSDTLIGTGNNYVFNGGAGSNDTLSAAGSNDTLIGGSGGGNLFLVRGNNTIEGAGVNNTVNYAVATNAVVLTLDASGAATDAVGDTLTDIQNIIGGQGNDTLTVNASGDTLEAGTGADTLIGSSAGGDTFVVSHLDTIIGHGNNNTLSFATISTPFAFTLQSSGNGTDVLGDTYSDITDVVGGSGSDTLTTDLNAGIVSGGAGTGDTLIGNGYYETLIGGSGGDNVLNATGMADTLIAGGSGDTLEGGAGGQNLFVLRGHDTVIGNGAFNTISYAGVSGQISVTLVSGWGSDNLGDTFEGGVTNVIIAGSGNDTISVSGISNDTLEAGSGTDTLTGSDATFFVNATDTVIGLGTANTVSYANISGPVDVTLGSNGSSSGNDNLGDTLTNIETLTAGSGSDTLSVSGTGNLLNAGSGLDTLSDLGTGGFYSYGRFASQIVINNGSASNGGPANELDINQGPNFSDENLWFAKSGNNLQNLQIDVLGTNQSMTIDNWFSSTSTSNQLATIDIVGNTNFSYTLADSTSSSGGNYVTNLVQAMAKYANDTPGFNPTAAATQMPTDSTLQNAIVDAWQVNQIGGGG